MHLLEEKLQSERPELGELADGTLTGVGRGIDIPPGVPAGPYINIPLEEPKSIVHEIQDLLDREIQSTPTKEDWLPISSIHKIFNRENVRGILREKFPELENDSKQLEKYVDRICNTSFSKQIKSKANSCRRLLALLCYLDKSDFIISFLKDDMCDFQLPVSIEERKGEKVVLKYDGTPLEAVRSWKQLDKRKLVNEQMKVIVPYFTRGPSRDGDRPVLYYPLPDRVILPWIEDEEKLGTVIKSDFSSVWRVKIHPDHHDLIDNKVCLPVLFAFSPLKHSIYLILLHHRPSVKS